MELLTSLHSAILAPVELGLHDWLIATRPASPTLPFKSDGRLPSWSSSDWSRASSAAEDALPKSAANNALPKSALRSRNQGGRHASAASRRVSFSKGLEIGPSSPRNPSSVRMSNDYFSVGDLSRLHARPARFAAQQQFSLSSAQFWM